MIVVYYNEDKEICRKIVKFKLYKGDKYHFIRLNNVRLTIPKGERIVYIGLKDDMFNLSEAIIPFKLNNEYYSNKRDMSVTLESQMIRIDKEQLCLTTKRSKGGK